MSKHIEISVNGYNVGGVEIMVYPRGVYLKCGDERITIPHNSIQEAMECIQLAMIEYEEVSKMIENFQKEGKQNGMENT